MPGARRACKGTRKEGGCAATLRTLAVYAESLSLLDARRVYFDANGFGPDGGYAKRWVKVELGPLPLWFPNSEARVRAVRYHDLHHVATGYDTDWTGEGEIAAWEIASSCRGFLAAWWLNLSAMAIGLALAPSRIFRAFVRGRHTQNLYAERFDDALLATSVGALRKQLDLASAEPAANAADRAAFAGWCVAAVAALIVQAALLVTPIALLIRSAV
jgi:hypothetical protein